ncbi:MAG TPA: amidohydrolase family protein [Gemmatimonadaceae bacterium]|nr:amidohydrolase family protein [Gemmatimonadaceae bacterium]
MRRLTNVSMSLLLVQVAVSRLAPAQQRTQPLPIIDVHLHAMSAEELRTLGPNPITRAAPPSSIEEHVRRTVEEMKKHNVVLGIVGGRTEDVERFLAVAPERVWGSAKVGRPELNVDSLITRHSAGKIAALGEVMAQYEGFSPSDSAFEPYWSLAEKLDIPIAIHTGVSFPGITQRGFPNFRVALGNPILFEGLLNRHPKLRVSMMHAGYPFLAETIGILSVYPQVYVYVGVIDWIMPREEFHAYLRELVRAGFADRIMFGSDQMTWPDAIGLAVGAIESAQFLTEQQKRDIFYDNAARFLRLSPDVIARHHRRLAPSETRRLP